VQQLLFGLRLGVLFRSRDFECKVLRMSKEIVARDYPHKTGLLLVLNVIPDQLDVLIGEGAYVWARSFCGLDNIKGPRWSTIGGHACDKVL
jgi:hypothetical protein